ncbi:MAG: hypothetical protein D6781_10625 [Verrucomicrobia bacterium]|nr:MAG: hypothetical protein D6781_10625 [Verrucomicrobiota bacterium]
MTPRARRLLLLGTLAAAVCSQGLVLAAPPAADAAGLSPQQKKLAKEHAINASLKIISVTPEGIIATATARRSVQRTYTWTENQQGTGLASHKTYRVRRSAVRNETERTSLGTIFVAMPTDGLVDGQNLERWIWPVGTTQYTTVLGARATVRAYTTRPADFLATLAP